MIRGLIVLWYGALTDIPDGYVLCNGANGTPDLRDKFVAGAGISYLPGMTGGVATHNHNFTTDGHFHTFAGGVDIGAGIFVNQNTNSKTDTGQTDNAIGLPPYYALAYIMKT